MHKISEYLVHSPKIGQKSYFFCYLNIVFSFALYESEVRAQSACAKHPLLLQSYTNYSSFCAWCIPDLEWKFCQIFKLGPTTFVLASSLLPLVLWWIKRTSHVPTLFLRAGSEFLSLLRISEFFSFYIADFLSHLGKWVKSNQIWGWKWIFLHLEGWKTTMYHMYTLILQCSCH